MRFQGWASQALHNGHVSLVTEADRRMCALASFPALVSVRPDQTTRLQFFTTTPPKLTDKINRGRLFPFHSKLLLPRGISMLAYIQYLCAVQYVQYKIPKKKSFGHVNASQLTSLLSAAIEITWGETPSQ